MFFLTALLFVLVGGAYVLYYYLPIGNENTFFYGFFAMALILILLGALAGLVAARAVKKGSPPVPNLAIDEARKIRESVGPTAGVTPVAGAGLSATAAGEPSVPSPAARATDANANAGGKS